MKPVAKPQPFPAGVVKMAARTTESFTLIVILDGYPYLEIAETTALRFKRALEKWVNAGNVAQLKGNDSVRYFVRSEDKSLNEVKF
jgi:hypothetical protein